LDGALLRSPYVPGQIFTVMRKREKSNIVFQENKLQHTHNIPGTGKKNSALVVSHILSFSLQTNLPLEVMEGGQT
jgi:hypothetical protein